MHEKDVSMSSDTGALDEDSYANEYSQVEVVIKPRNNYSSNALRHAVPRTDLNKKRESLSMSMINMRSSGRSQSRFFSSSALDTKEEGARHLSFNTIAKQISFASPRGRDFAKALRESANIGQKNPVNAHISEASEGDSDDSSVRSDTTSSESSGSDSSIEAAINGSDETE